MKTVAIRRMQAVVRDWHAKKRNSRSTVSVGLPASMADHDVWTQLSADLGNIELAYHHGEIADAISKLTKKEREYVYCRFWLGMKLPELTEHFGYVPGPLWQRGKKKLQKELAHLGAE